MRISSLIYFYEVAQLKSISKVSNKFHISQPALSHQLSSLEKELGVKILERSNKGVKLTDKGKILYNYSKEMIKLHNNLLDDISMESETKKEIKINILSTYGNFLVDNISNNLVEIFDKINININNKSEDNEKSILLHNRADLVIGCKKIEDDDLVCEHIGTNKLLLVGKNYITYNDIEELSIAILDDKINTITNILDELKNTNTYLKTNSIDIIKSYMNNQNIALIVPEIAVRKELKSKKLINLYEFKCNTEYDLYISYRKDTTQSLKIKFKLFKQSLENILKEEYVL